MVLSERQQEALQHWYERQEVLDVAKRLFDEKSFLRLEDFVHKGCLMPLKAHDALPDYMKDEDGVPLFPENLDPREVEDQWQDAIEIGWQVIHARLGITHDEVHRAIADQQSRDWDEFIESVERRKRERGLA